MRDTDAYRTEHMLAWVMAGVAILLGALGALEAFDILNLGDARLSAQSGADIEDDAGIFADGALLLIPSIIASFLAFTLHRNEHHERSWGASSRNNIATTGNDRDALRREDDLAKSEHAGAYGAGIASVAFGLIGVLVGFNVFDDAHTFYDGLTWLMLSLLSSILAATLHSVGHHAPETSEDHIVMLIEERVRGSATATTLSGENPRTVR